MNFEVRIPTEMGGSGGPFTNPEQLFAAGYAACFDSALNFVARRVKEKITSEVTATVGLKSSLTMDLDLVVKMDVKIAGVEAEKAQELLKMAHETCPYSKAIRNNVDVEVNLIR